MRRCIKCEKEYGPSGFISVNSQFFNGQLPICRYCLTSMLSAAEELDRWNLMDKICQWANIPFIPEKWDEMYQADGVEAIGPYFAIFRNKEYERLNWSEYNEVYKELAEKDKLSAALPRYQDQQLLELQAKWGLNYDEEELEYLENLHRGLLASQSVVGALQEDQALKICKISLSIDEKIRDGIEFDKDLKSYDNLVKTANFTPKTSKNGDDFDSVGEIFAYLEKTGWINKYYDGAVRDEVDNTMKNIQNWCRRLYTNESGIGEEITERIQNLRLANQEANYDEKDFDDFDLKFDRELNEEFEVDLNE